MADLDRYRSEMDWSRLDAILVPNYFPGLQEVIFHLHLEIFEWDVDEPHPQMMDIEDMIVISLPQVVARGQLFFQWYVQLARAIRKIDCDVLRSIHGYSYGGHVDEILIMIGDHRADAP